MQNSKSTIKRSPVSGITSKSQKKKKGGCLSFLCCCARPQQTDQQSDQKYKQPQSKLNIHSPPQPIVKHPLQPQPPQDTDDLIDQRYSTSASRNIEEESFPFSLPDLRECPVMQVYEHHIVRLSNNQLIG